MHQGNNISDWETIKHIYTCTHMHIYIHSYILEMCSVCVCVSVRLPGPETITLMILILFGGGRYCPRDYGKNTKKLKLCIIMHKYAKYAFF